MKRILFVDDEASVLRGLGRLLRPMRDTWDMVFSESGAEALDLMQQEPFDVVVADISMPGMDGIELLAEVRERFPTTVRIILSGESDPDLMLRSVVQAHQFLSKPCNTPELKATVDRACFLRDLLSNERLLRLASQIKALPSRPRLYTLIQEELKKPASSMESIGAIISQDVAMSAKILQLVNSAFFGLRRSVADPAAAAGFLGVETIKSLALSAQVFSQCETELTLGFSIDELWDHSLRTANYARTIAMLEGCETVMVEQCFAAGMLHEAGKLVIAANLPDKFHRARHLAHKIEPMALNEAERRVLGASLDVVGGYLMGIWGLPSPIVEAIACLHRPDSCPHESFSVLTAVHAANAIDAERQDTPPGLEEELCLPYIERLGLTSRLDVWREACFETKPEQEEEEAA